VEIEIFFTGGLSKSFFDNVHHDAKLICVCKQSCKRGVGNSGLPNETLRANRYGANYDFSKDHKTRPLTKLVLSNRGSHQDSIFVKSRQDG